MRKNKIITTARISVAIMMIVSFSVILLITNWRRVF